MLQPITRGGGPMPAPDDALRPACGPPRRTFAVHMLFDAAPPAAVMPAGTQPRIRFNLRNRSRRGDAGLCEVVLELTVSCARGDAALYRVEVHQAGVFDLAAIPEAERPRVLNTDCPRALFPIAKASADALVRGGGFPPFELPAVDFDAVYARQGATPQSQAPLAVLDDFWQSVRHLQARGRQTPRPTDFRATHAEALAVAQRSRDALPAADAVLETGPHDRDTLDILAAVYSMNNLHRQTATVYRLAVETRPGDARAHYNLATSLMFNGNLDGAAREITSSLRCQPTFWDAYTVRAQIRRWSRADNHVDELLALLRRHAADAQAQERLHMALGKEYEDLGDYPRAFAHMAEGNRVGRLRRGYGFAQDAAIFDALVQYAPPAQPAAAGAAGEPIFVFGMPRSGTTLVDRILSSHPQVASAGELKQFGMLLKCASGSPTEELIDADTLRRARSLDWHALGRDYLAATRPLTGATPRFVDKFPHHFLYAGHIANALPRARLVCVRRNPMDTCLGNFRQVFSESSPFHGYACDVMDTGNYYVRFDRLMAHWRRAFQDRIFELHYEDLVEHQEATTRALLEFCGLPWDPACLAFERNAAPVATASAVQVRAPLYRDALHRWTAYAEQLAPLRELLEREGIDVGASGT